MRIRLESRGEHSPAWLYLSPVVAVLLTLASGVVIFSALGKDPGAALFTFFVQPWLDGYSRTELVVKAAPLALIGIGLSLGFRANVWNIGAEGQFTMGAIAGAGLAIFAPEDSGYILLVGVLIFGVLGGMAWGAIPAFLRTKFNANEILTSLMLSYVAILFLSYLVHGPWRDPGGFNFPESKLFPDGAVLPILVEGTRLHMGTLFALAAVVAGWIFLARSAVGFQMKVLGLAPAAARYAGFKEKRLVWLALLISGGAAGLAGAAEVSGPIGQLLPSISPGYGFTAIIAAFLGRLHPVGVLLAAFVMALTYIGGEMAQIEIGLSAAVTGLFQGILLFFLLACDVLTSYRLRIGSPRTQGAA